MARRNSNESGNTAVLENEDEATEVETTEVTPEPEATVTPEPEATVTPEPEATGAPAEADLTPFTTAATTAVGQRDTNSGDLPEGAMDPVLTAYRALPDTKARNRAKVVLKDAMKEAMAASDMPLARAYFALSEGMTTSTTKVGGERKPVDPTAQWKSNIVTALLAYSELAANAPEGFDGDPGQFAAAEAGKLTESVNTWRTFLDAPEPAEGEEAPEKPEVPSEVVSAFRLVRGGKVRATRSASTGGTGERRDLGKHIKEAFDAVEDGTFLSVAEIKKHKSSEYPDESPSAGAISARLFPKSGPCTVEGIEPGVGGDKNTKGAYKRQATADVA